MRMNINVLLRQLLRGPVPLSCGLLLLSPFTSCGSSRPPSSSSSSSSSSSPSDAPIVIIDFKDGHTSSAAGNAACDRFHAIGQRSPVSWFKSPTPHVLHVSLSRPELDATPPPHGVGRDRFHLQCDDVLQLRSPTPAQRNGCIILSGCGVDKVQVEQPFRHVIVCPRGVGPLHRDGCPHNASSLNNSSIAGVVSETAAESRRLRFVRPETGEPLVTTSATGGNVQRWKRAPVADGETVAVLGCGVDALLALDAHLPVQVGLNLNLNLVHGHSRLLPHVSSQRTATAISKRLKRAGVSVHGFTGVSWVEVDRLGLLLHTVALYDRFITDATPVSRLYVTDETGAELCGCEALHGATSTAAGQASVGPPFHGPELGDMTVGADFTLTRSISVVGGRYVDAATHAVTSHTHDLKHAETAAQHAVEVLVTPGLEPWSRGYSHVRSRAWDAQALGFRGVAVGDVSKETSVCVFDFNPHNLKRGDSPLETAAPGVQVGVALHTRVCPTTSTIAIVGVTLYHLYNLNSGAVPSTWAVSTVALRQRAAALITATADGGLVAADRTTLTALLHVAAFALAQESVAAVTGRDLKGEWTAPGAHTRLPVAVTWIPPAGAHLAAMNAAAVAQRGAADSRKRFA